jgi:hypothetical protein
MNDKLKTILDAVTSVEVALLRFRNEEGQQNLQVKIAFSAGNSVHCIIPGEIPEAMKIDDKKIHLIQKYHDDYFFISGYISGEVQNTPRILSIAISKACWFVRKRRGSVIWLHEKYTYENEQEKMRHAS